MILKREWRKKEKIANVPKQQIAVQPEKFSLQFLN
jgi:hypothetical protein